MKRFAFYLLAIWLVILPWHAFLKTWFSALFLGSNADILPISSNIFSLWKEICLLLLLLYFIWSQRKNLKLPFERSSKLLLLSYIVSLILFGILKTPSWSASILGLRTDLLFIPAMLVGIWSATFFSQSDIHKILRSLFISLSISFGIFIFLWFLKPDIGLLFGYSPYQSSFVENKPLPLYLCIFVQEHCIPRLQASFSGPNQAASLAVLLGGIGFYLRQSLAWVLFPISALVLTFSRSAFIGAAIAFLSQLPKKWLLYCTTAVAIVGISAFIIIPEAITHGLSSSEHWDKTIHGIERIMRYPLGTGLGSVGPVARRLFGEANAVISENWYIQIGQEAGIITFLLLICTTISIIWHLLHSKNRLSKITGMILFAASIQALFLHLWEDSVVTMLIWFWVGVGLCYNTIDSTN